jgi:hypothetical protein
MANIGHDHEHNLGENYDAASDAPVAGWVKLHPADDVDSQQAMGQSNSDGGWKQT